MTENDRNDVLIDSCDAMLENACKMVAMSKEHQTNVMQVIYVDSDGNDAVAYVYDFNFHTWKSADTFDRLAADLLGNANLGTLIAYFNEIDVESEIVVGTKIKIPILTQTSNIQGNRIYAMPEKQENYGIDIALNKDGEFETKDGDFASVKGQDNLSQALMLRLTTASGNRIRLTSYGIRSAIGDTMAMRSYLLSSIEQTVKADPRIKDIEEISFKGNKSALELEIVYTDINGNDGTHTGEI